ncbi:MAG TPA: hypothetical protein VFS77_21215 [Pyrinomonadaceae bacterium]|nr:hypothetical protein [Pyrinomonadaceae bacterium]
MLVSHLTDSVATMLASALNTLTGGSFSHLTTGEDELLARVVSEMTGQSYSHLTTSRDALWALMLGQATTDGISFDANTQGPQQIMAVIANNVYGGEEEGYETGAVHFDGANSSIALAAFAAADSPLLSYSCWFKAAANQSSCLWVVRPDYFTTFNNLSSGLMHIGLSDADANFVMEIISNAGAYSLNAWHHLLFTADTNFGDGLKKIKFYIDDADVTNILYDGNDPFPIGFNGLNFILGATGAMGIEGELVMDIADFWFAPGQTLLTGSDISEATRRKFIDASGKPVNLGAAGATPIGVAPAIFCRRAPAAAASTFASNLGADGALVLTGSLTNAATSPSD